MLTSSGSALEQTNLYILPLQRSNKSNLMNFCIGGKFLEMSDSSLEGELRRNSSQSSPLWVTRCEKQASLICFFWDQGLSTCSMSSNKLGESVEKRSFLSSLSVFDRKQITAIYVDKSTFVTLWLTIVRNKMSFLFLPLVWNVIND